jgi:hypothetical protein
MGKKAGKKSSATQRAEKAERQRLHDAWIKSREEWLSGRTGADEARKIINRVNAIRDGLIVPP